MSDYTISKIETNTTFFHDKYLKQVTLTFFLIPRQNKLSLTADFMRIKYENPKLKQSEIANR